MADGRDGDVRWRRLSGNLWAASRDGVTFGTVEHLGRYLASDGTGGLIGRYRTLDDAMRALELGEKQVSARDRIAVGGGRIAFGFGSGFGIGAIAIVGWALIRGLV